MNFLGEFVEEWCCKGLSEIIYERELIDHSNGKIRIYI